MKYAAVQILELLLEGDAPQPVGDVHDLRQTRREERQTPQEKLRGARIRPSPDCGAEKAECQEGEQVEESIKPAAPHEAEEEEDVGEVEHGALRAVPPRLTQRVGGRRVRHREVQSLEVRRLHGSGWEGSKSLSHGLLQGLLEPLETQPLETQPRLKSHSQKNMSASVCVEVTE